MITSERMQNLHPYIPGEQPKDRDYIKLNANENPYPPSPKVIESVTDFISKNPEKLSLYPDPDSLELHKAIADMLNKSGGILSKYTVPTCLPKGESSPFIVTPDMIYTGNGSDEVLSFLFYAFFSSNKKFVMPEFTYSFYPVYAGFYNIPMDQVPLKSDWSLDVDEMIKRANENHAGIIFANPNAPTGRALSRDEVRAMLEKANRDEIFIVDEAYADFGDETCIPLIKEFDNLVIVRTFSKSMCGAGMRLGYIVSSPALINTVTTVKNSVNHFPLDAVAQVAGIEACKNFEYYADCAKKVVDERESFQDFLTEHGWEVIPSKTNFVFARCPAPTCLPKGESPQTTPTNLYNDKSSPTPPNVPDQIHAKPYTSYILGHDLYTKIKSHGILVRHFATPGIEDFLRITIGTHEQMDALKKIIDSITRGQ